MTELFEALIMGQSLSRLLLASARPAGSLVQLIKVYVSVFTPAVAEVGERVFFGWASWLDLGSGFFCECQFIPQVTERVNGSLIGVRLILF